MVGFSQTEKISARIANPQRLDVALRHWAEVALSCEDAVLAADLHRLSSHPLLAAAFANSPFLTHCLIRDPAFARDLFRDGPDATLTSLTGTLAADCRDEEQLERLMQLLRIAKRRCALLVGLADMAGRWDLDRVTGVLSAFAEQSIRIALRYLLKRAAGKGDFALADPDDPEKDSGMLVLGMGKLGAYELNYSSDIDLVVIYDEDKLVYAGRKSLRECIIQLTKDLVRILDERTADGYVFRTDLRLRPDPGSTPVAVTLAAAEIYYEGFGQNWERAAMIKARQVAGDPETGAYFLKFLRPFIWRKSLDFAAISDIHSIKRQINAHKGGHTIKVAGHNVKLGRGGIREIEFFAQTQQLIWGGRLPRMRTNRTVDALAALAEGGQVLPQVAEQLTAAYGYLRTLEHRIQMVDDKQTQTLPTTDEGLAEIAAFMGHADLDEFAARLTEILRTVEAHYAALFEDSPALDAGGNLVFTGGENDPDTEATIAAMGFGNAAAVCSTIRGWHHGRIRATRSTRARELLTELTPALLRALAGTATPDEAFMRFDEFISHLPAGVPVFSLFHANPSLLELVAEVMGNAPKLALHLARNPGLLDSVLQPRFFEPLPSVAALKADLGEVLDRADDFQAVLDQSRRWCNDHKFQVGVLTMRGILSPDEAARAFSDIADAVLDRLAPKVEAEFAQAHGRIPGAGWALLAMGKAGGREMTATSDLDLILVYESPDDSAESDGKRPLGAAVWFARFTQRLVTAITAQTPEGTLYEVDMRLRPSGNSGPVASSLAAFGRYHQEAAWTWEHMALTRTRVVTGVGGVADRVMALVRATLTRQRVPDTLLRDVAEMRTRILATHATANRWEVKHVRGGLVDVEFIVQYLQLRHGADHPEILCPNTGDALMAAEKAGILSHGDRDSLLEAWRLWSAVQTVLRQTVAGAFDESSAPRGVKDVLTQTSGVADFHSLIDRMDDCAKAALDVYDRLIEIPFRALPPVTG